MASTPTSTPSAASFRQFRHASPEEKPRQTAASTPGFDTSTLLRHTLSPASTHPPLLLRSGGVGGCSFVRLGGIFVGDGRNRHQPIRRGSPTCSRRRERGENVRRRCTADQPLQPPNTRVERGPLFLFLLISTVLSRVKHWRDFAEQRRLGDLL